MRTISNIAFKFLAYCWCTAKPMRFKYTLLSFCNTFPCVTFNISEYSKYLLIFFLNYHDFPQKFLPFFFSPDSNMNGIEKCGLSVMWLNSKMNFVLFSKLKSYVRYVAQAEYINWCPCRVIVCHSVSLMPLFFILLYFLHIDNAFQFGLYSLQFFPDFDFSLECFA